MSTISRREFCHLAALPSVAGAMGINAILGPKSMPEKIETCQVYRTQSGHLRIIGDRWHDGRWSWSGPIQPGNLAKKVDYWVTDLAWPIEIRSWTYCGTISDLIVDEAPHA